MTAEAPGAFVGVDLTLDDGLLQIPEQLSPLLELTRPWTSSWSTICIDSRLASPI
jgi:hypothetical protein